MVLSRKKLKQKFRSLVTESIADNELKNSRRGISSSADVNQELESIRELLFTKSRKPKLHKRGKRQKNRTLPEDLKNGVATLEACEGNMDISENGGKDGFDDLKENGKGKKRKSGNNGGQDLEEGLQNTEKLEKKKDNKIKKKKKKRREVKLKKKGKDGVEGQDNSNNGDAVKSVNAESKIQEVAVPVQVDESEKTKVYIGGIPYYSSEDDIISFFQGCGTVTEMDCMTFPETGKFRGIAILTFKTEGGAQRALALDGADMGGFFLKIQPYKASRNQKSDFAPEIIDGYHRVYVGNLSWDISEDDLKKLFSDCKISSVRFGTDKETGDFKGYAHVDFTDSVSLTIALKLDQSVLCGRPVRIRCAVPRKSGQSESISISGQKKQEVKQVVEDFSVNADDSAGAEETPVVESVSASADTSAGARKPKRKRQTCYVCGTPGHISSDCPQKTANAAS